MKKLMLFGALLTIASQAWAIKPCEELKAEIAAKIDANGVKSYTLDILPAEQEDDRTVVGTCNGGTGKIVYRRG